MLTNFEQNAELKMFEIVNFGIFHFLKTYNFFNLKTRHFNKTFNNTFSYL